MKSGSKMPNCRPRTRLMGAVECVKRSILAPPPLPLPAPLPSGHSWGATTALHPGGGRRRRRPAPPACRWAGPAHAAGVPSGGGAPRRGRARGCGGGRRGRRSGGGVTPTELWRPPREAPHTARSRCRARARTCRTPTEALAPPAEANRYSPITLPGTHVPAPAGPEEPRRSMRSTTASTEAHRRASF